MSKYLFKKGFLCYSYYRGGTEMKRFKLFMGVLIGFLVLGTTAVKAEDTLQDLIDSASNGDTVKLTTNYTESISIEEDKNLTLDLNGYTLTSCEVEVMGNLTVIDSQEGGTIACSTNNWSTIVVEGGTFTLESGTITNSTYYGIYAKDGGTATINGGTINSKDSPLAGNNTTGAMNFYVNGGVLTATQGPTIYMAGPININITGGTLNGGISLRMGKVNISGGVINATTGEIDSPTQYYNYSGNAWLPDALYVYGGTYNTNIEGETNVLELNITGGTFNCKNGQGSAIAIYDLGKVEQNMTINISGNPVFNTNSENRDAYQILSLEDINVTSPAAGFGTYVGNVVTNITGGTFNSVLDDSYIADGYKQDDDGTVIEIEVEPVVTEITSDTKVEEVTIGIATDDMEEVEEILKSSIAADETISALIGNEDISVEINIEAIDEEDMDEDLVAEITKALEKKAKDATIVGYFDINIDVLDASGQPLGTLTELTDKIKLTIALPEELQEVKEGYTRTFYVIREHDDEIEVIEATLSDDGKFVTFETDKFSTYALSYADSETETTSPATFDEISLIMIIGMLSFVLFVLAIIYAKKRRFN